MNNSLRKLLMLRTSVVFRGCIRNRYSVLDFQFPKQTFHSAIPRKYAATATAPQTEKSNAENKSTNKGSGSTVTPGEVEKFEKMASSWWDPDGQMKELHSMNRLRVPLVRDGLLTGRNDIQGLLDSPTPLKGYTLLDVGCGGGILTEPLGRLGASVIGIDPGKENISVAEVHLAPELRTRVSYDCTTIEEYAQNNAGMEFDGIVMSEIIEHVENPEAFLEIAVQLTKIGGSIFLTTLNRTFESWAGAVVAWEYLLRRLPVGTHSWNKFLAPQELQGILLNNGCRVKLVHGMCYNPLTNSWNWSKSTSINYCIHAIRES